jgi:hypothetical protein
VRKATPRKTGLIAVLSYIEPWLYELLRLAAFQRGTSMSHVIAEALRKELAPTQVGDNEDR